MPRSLAALFVLIALPVCMMLAAIVPPGQVADEPGHIARAAALVHGDLHGTRRLTTGRDGRASVESGVLVDTNLWGVAFVLRPGGKEKLDTQRYADYRALGWSGTRIFAEIGTLALYMPVFYMPGAMGLAVAEGLRMPPYDAVILGRIASAVCFVVLGAAALHVARRGRALMFCVLACPMTLSLAASFNQDGLLIGASVLAAALATRTDSNSRLGAAVLLGCVAAVKLPYLPLAALLLVQRGETWQRRAVLAALVAVPAVIWTVTMLATVSAPVVRPPHLAGPLWPGDPATTFTGTDPLAQLRVLLASPPRLLWLPARTMAHDPWLLREGIGVLGWLNVPLPQALYHGWMIALACALLADLLAAADQQVPPGDTLLLCGAALLAVWGIYISQYLTWTDVGLDHVDGPSGRYFLPLLPLVGLALPSLRPLAPGLSHRRRAHRVAAAAPVVAAAAGVIALPMVIVGAYYLR